MTRSRRFTLTQKETDLLSLGLLYVIRQIEHELARPGEMAIDPLIGLVDTWREARELTNKLGPPSGVTLPPVIEELPYADDEEELPL